MANRPWRRAVVGFIAVGVSSMALFGEVVPHLRDTAERAVVLQLLPCQGDKDRGASGMVIDDETVVSVAHAIVDSREVFVRDSELQWWRATVQHVDRDLDLAVLHVPGLRATAMAVTTAGTSDVVTMVEGLTTGTVSGEVMRRVVINTTSIGSDVETRRRGYELDIEVEPGDSGAGIVDESGRLVGVVFAQSTRRESVAWATEMAPVSDLIAVQNPPDSLC